MTEEKAIDYFKSYINAIDTYGTIDKNCCNNLYEPAKVVLELVEKLKTDLEKAYATIVDQTDKDNEIEYLEDLLKGNLYDGYVYYKDLAREYQEKWIPKDKIRERIMLESFDYFGKRCIKVEDIEDLLENEEEKQ